MSEEINNSERDFEDLAKYAKLMKNYIRPPNTNKNYYNQYTRYSKSDILELLNYPDQNEKALRNASIYLYNMSSHYRRLISYFASMPTYDYYLVPLKIDSSSKINAKSLKSCFKKATDQVELMNLKHELVKIAKTCFREDVFYGYEYESKDSYFIQPLKPDYCRIVAVEDGVYVFEFDFSYFNSRSELLEYYGSEFKKKYELYKKNSAEMRWQELNSKNSVCFKLNEDLNYIIPPFAGTFPDIYDIADYKQLMKAKTEVENYKLLSMKLPFENGEFQIPLPLAREFYSQVASQLPEGIGLGLSPMDMDDFSFDQSGSTQNTDAVTKSEAAFWSAAGASAAILGGDVTSSSAIMLSIETDAGIVYSFLRQVERWINKKLKQLSGTYHFKLVFLNSTIYNRKEIQKQMLEACQYSLPAKYAASAAYGISPSDFEGLLVLENEVMALHEKMVPVASSHTQTSDNSEAGRPAQDTVDETGEQTRGIDANDNR